MRFHSGPVRIIIVVMNVETITKKKDIAAIAQSPHVAQNMMNVVHLDLPFPGESLTIKDLQGTMITGAEAMMTAERLIIILTAAGTIRTDAETTEDAMTRTSALMRGRGTQMEKDGRVEWYLFFKGRVRKKRTADWHTGLFRLSDLCGVVVYTDRVLLMVNRWSTSPRRRVRSIYISLFEAHLGTAQLS